MGMRDDFLRAMKKGEVTLMVLADFFKAFDTVNYKVLITKLSTLGFSKPFLRWLNSYLSDRSHFVQIDDRTSESVNVRCGVPQGSILCPVLFNLVPIYKIISLPRLVLFNTLTILKYTPAVQLLSYKDVRKN